MKRVLRRSGRVAAGVVLAALAGCAADNGGGSSRGADEVAGDMARLAIELGSLDHMLDRGAELAWGASLDAFTLEIGREPTEAERVAGRAAIRGALADVLTPATFEEAAVRVYAANFSAAELEEMLVFYDSPVGRKTIQLEEKIAGEVDDAMERILGGEQLDALIDKIDEALEAAFPELADRGES